MDEQIKFVKLRNGEDLVASVKVDGDNYILTRPVAIMIENIFEEAKQLLNVREWLPLTIVSADSTTLDKSEVIVLLDVNEDFIEQYHEICEMFFDNKPTIKKNKRKTTSSDDKVITFAEALANMIDKKDKPVH